MTELHWCDGCAADVAFDRFDCDDHGGDCLELVCTRCGAGLELVAVGIAEASTAVLADGTRQDAAA